VKGARKKYNAGSGIVSVSLIFHILKVILFRILYFLNHLKAYGQKKPVYKETVPKFQLLEQA
jgi:hypothetical protein